MSARPKSTTWKAEPHTIAKIEIVKRYSHRWAVILGQSFRGQPLTYIDGFAGPGEYTNHPEGSPTAAIQSFIDARQNTPEWVAGNIRCVFVEGDSARSAHLSKKCSEVPLPTGISVTHKCCNFVDGIQRAKEEFGRAFLSNAPLLVFVDPFGATGAPFSAIEEILGSGTSEVIVNFDADGVARIWSAGSSSDAERHLTDIYGGNAWKSILWNGLSHRERCFACARLYKQRLLSLPKVEYAFSFEMGGASNRLDYFLIFASQSEKGLEKMKEVMKGIDQSGDFKFYDTKVGQEQLFKFDQPELWIHPMLSQFSGRFVQYAELKRWILNETPFVTFKETMLKPAMEKGLLQAIPRQGVIIRKGTFPETKLNGIQFAEVADG